MTSRYPEMSDATTGVAHAKARVSTIPKLSPPREGATSAFARQQLLREPVLVEEAEHLDAVVGHTQPGHQQPHAERIGADHAQIDTGTPADLRPRVQEHVQALAPFVAAREDDAILAPVRVRFGRG